MSKVGRFNMSDAKKNDKASNQTLFGNHAIAVIDLLGQSARLSAWDFVPQDERQQAAFIIAVRNSWGIVDRTRRALEDCFLAFNELRPPKWAIERVPEAHRESIIKMAQYSIQYLHFSDTIVAYTRITNDHNYLTARGIKGLLYATGAVLLASLALKTPFRAGIDIGMAGCFGDIDLYGPGLSKAHHLENKVAKYPRIVVGESLMKYLTALEGVGPLSLEANFAAVSAKHCRGFLCQDTDGAWIVDYLNDEFAQLAADAKLDRQLRDAAFRFALEMHESAEKSSDPNLPVYYERLVAYFKSRGHG